MVCLFETFLSFPKRNCVSGSLVRLKENLAYAVLCRGENVDF